MAAGYNLLDNLNNLSKEKVDNKPKARFKSRDVNINRIYPSDDNFYPQTEIDEKAAEIEAVGLLENLTIKYNPCEKGDYELVDGERRWRALKQLIGQGKTQYEIATCHIRESTSKQETIIERIIANSQRPKDTHTILKEEIELKEALTYMKDNDIPLKGFDLKNGTMRDIIAKLLNKSNTKIAQIENINNNLILEFKEELYKNAITISAAYEIAGLIPDEQREILNIYIETGEMTYKQVKERKIKKAETEQLQGQIKIEDIADPNSSHEEIKMSESDIEIPLVEHETEFAPQPQIQPPICWKCLNFNKCSEKGETVKQCNEYIDKTKQQSSKVEQQKKSAEQKEESSFTSLKELKETQKEKVHQIRIASMFYEDAATGRKSFELRKNDRDYRVGDTLEMTEFKDGANTGRVIRATITYLLQDYTGLTDGYCILGIQVIDYTP